MVADPQYRLPVVPVVGSGVLVFAHAWLLIDEPVSDDFTVAVTEMTTSPEPTGSVPSAQLITPLLAEIAQEPVFPAG
jgi:hypothetical protein